MRAIDADRLQKQFNEKSTNPNYRVNMHNIKSIISNAPTVEAIPKADYENCLKADMVAMLTDIQLEIREYHEIGCDEDCNNCHMVGCIEPVDVIKDLDIIQQKIDALKEVVEDGKRG